MEESELCEIMLWWSGMMILCSIPVSRVSVSSLCNDMSNHIISHHPKRFMYDGRISSSSSPEVEVWRVGVVVSSSSGEITCLLSFFGWWWSWCRDDFITKSLSHKKIYNVVLVRWFCKLYLKFETKIEIKFLSEFTKTFINPDSQSSHINKLYLFYI